MKDENAKPYTERNKDKLVEYPITTLVNQCPECGGNLHDGTGTGWLICESCHELF